MREESLSDFEGWYSDAYPAVCRTLLFLCRDREVSVDCAQDAFATAYAQWSRVSEMASPRQWVVTVAVNKLRRSQRRRAFERLRAHSADDGGQTVKDFELWEAVGRLPRRQREAVVLRYIGDFTEADVARHLGISEGGASSLLSKAREALRGELYTEGDLYGER